LEHRARNPVSVNAIETSTIVKLLRPYVPVGTKRASSSLEIKEDEMGGACDIFGRD
jgi:hypothetical protein